jgi:hypothetical protein
LSSLEVAGFGMGFGPLALAGMWGIGSTVTDVVGGPA